MNKPGRNQYGPFIKSEPYEYYDSFLQARGKQPAEPHVCRQFGCGRHLSFMEMLYGDKCFGHSVSDKREITKYISY